MFWRTLRKDLERKKMMNAVLLMFIVLCSLLLSSSVNNLLMTNGALKKFAAMSRAADYYLFGRNSEGISDWVKRSELVIDYEEKESLSVWKGEIQLDGMEFWCYASQLMLTTPSQKFNHVFDENDNLITAVNDGECCITRMAAEQNNAVVGDMLTITIGEISRTLTIAHVTKDYAYGSEAIMISRILLGNRDYEALATEVSHVDIRMLSIITNDVDQLIMEKNQQNFVGIVEYSSSYLVGAYYLENIVSNIMPIISVILIAISLSLFCFSTRSAIEDDYREIGVMKAIGVSSSCIQTLYYAKYLVISLVGSFLGVCLSQPFSNLINGSLRKRVVLESFVPAWLTGVLCASAIVTVTMLAIGLSAGKVRKVSAIQAIRQGSQGVRFKQKGTLHLMGKNHLSGRKHKTRYGIISGVSAPLFMAFNDIVSGLRKYAIIFVALATTLLLIVLPYNAIATAKDAETMLPYIGTTTADLYTYPYPMKKLKAVSEEQDCDRLIEHLIGLERQCGQNNVAVRISANCQYAVQLYKQNEDDRVKLGAWKEANGHADSVTYLRGTPPVMSNEIAMTELLMKQLGVAVGDKVHIIIGENDGEYFITGSFEFMMFDGQYIVLSPNAYSDASACFSILSFQFVFAQRDDIKGQTKKLKEVLPEADFNTPDERINQLMENSIKTFTRLSRITITICLSIMALVVFLIGYTMLDKDKGAIALLKSIGFSEVSLRFWQIARIAIVAVVSAVFAITLSFVLTPAFMKMTFGTMGAENIKPAIKMLSVGVVLPGVSLLTAVLAAWVVSRGVKNVDKRSVQEATKK
ncbi:MAG: FtsX-like permease family protein [Gracilibacteraceae bacterium]|jgi:putative ABC transport system permease protein|nr:FtsX-like permease family protein [Gracilibacteraceae bacterium]